VALVLDPSISCSLLAILDSEAGPGLEHGGLDLPGAVCGEDEAGEGVVGGGHFLLLC